MDQAKLREILKNHQGEHLNLSHKGIKELPPEIGALTELKVLSLNDNALECLPSEIAGLTNLTELYLSSNQLQALPELEHLTKLTLLNLGNNQLQALPELQHLTNLTWLDLSRNQLQALPELQHLTKLTSLNLSSNQLQALPELQHLTKLTSLNLFSNQLQALAELQHLTKLTSLYLSFNQLQALAELEHLTKLTRLFLSDNQLTALPSGLGLATRLISVNFANNPWNDTFRSLLEHGKEAVLTYLREQHDHGVPRHEAKLLLVGEGAVGKSSLIAGLRRDPFILGRETTHGIETGTLTLDHPQTTDTPITLNTWDFGGQEVYRITHQFFFSRRALYLLVWKPREGVEEGNIIPWLKRLALRVPDARVLIVATHANERRVDLDETALKRQFPDMIRGFYPVDNADPAGLEPLKQAIAEEAAALPEMGDPMPESWYRLRKLLAERARQVPKINRAELDAFCQEAQVKEAQRPILAGLLHDLGDTIHYPDDDGLRDMVVLQPEWLTKAISHVLEDQVTADANGVLQHARLQAIWHDRVKDGQSRYARELHPFFLRLMEKFDICYRLENTQASLVGQMVPAQRPKNLPEPQGRLLRLHCRLKDPPEGLVAWMTVRCHRFAVDAQRHWRRGAFLAHQNHHALLELYDERLFSITVWGADPGHFMALLRDSLEYLIASRWPGLEYDQTVPCPSLEDSVPCSGYFKLASLHKARHKEVNLLHCTTCIEEHDVSALLTGFGAAKPEPDLLTGVQQVIRQEMKWLDSESRETPRLFSLTPRQGSWPERLNPGGQPARLMLWCEHPDCKHPIDAAQYDIVLSKQWLVKAAPWLNRIGKVLKLAASISGPGMGLLLGEAGQAAVKHHCALIDKLAGQLSGELELSSDLETTGHDIERAEGSLLYALRELLKDAAGEAWRDHLKRVRYVAGDYMWLCMAHYKEFEPGLPRLD